MDAIGETGSTGRAARWPGFDWDFYGDACRLESSPEIQAEIAGLGARYTLSDIKPIPFASPVPITKSAAAHLQRFCHAYHRLINTIISHYPIDPRLQATVLGNPKFQEAMRYLVDYEGMVNSFLKNQYKVHQSFWPSGFWAALDDTPFALDVERAKGLLQEIDIPADFTLNIDTLNESPFSEIAQSIQQTLGQAGIKSEIVLSEGKTLWPKYRARKHDLIVAYWGPDYLDPHSNADSFAHNPDNRLEAQLGGKLAWRNAWSDESINALTEKAAATLDTDEREQMYLELQRRLQDASPFVVMFQQNEQLARRVNVQGFVNGPSADLVFYRNTTK